MIQPDSKLTPEKLCLRRRGAAMVAKMEELYETSQDFRDWLQQGIDEIEAGNYTQMLFDDTGNITSEQEYHNGQPVEDSKA